MKPPRPPEEVLRRVIRFARLNGWSVVLFAGLGALVSLGLLDPLGVSVCLLIGLGGGLEVRGQRRLVRRDAGGMRGLVRGQLVVLAVVWFYAATHLISFDPVYLRDEVIPNARELLSSFGMDLNEIFDQAGLDASAVVAYVRLMFVALYGSLMLVTLIYQGGLALHYRHRTAAVEAALQPPPIPPAARAGEDYHI
jgi:hypothetical protein